ncbi:DNA-directed RNA polymerase III subunit RPC5, partial [Lunasporangiospora selenospora]
MPPKQSFKPTFTPSARSRKKAVEPTGDSDAEDNHMQEDVAPEGGVFEDELQKQERLEEEQAVAGKRETVEDRMKVESAAPSAPARNSNSTSHTKTEQEQEPMEVLSENGDSPEGEELLDPSENASQFESSMEVDHKSMEPDYADEGDELVKEIPVYLSQRLAKHLYLFQYPVRASALPYTHECGPTKARIKPLSQLIELELPLDTAASHYNRERGEELAMGMNDKPLRTALDEEPYDDDADKEVLDKQTLISSLVPSATNYLAGVLRNDELHLTPLHGTVQLRPSFKYLDKIDEKRKQANKKVNDENKEILAKQKADQEQKAKALQVQIRSAADSEARKAMGPNRARLAEDENWTKLDYFDSETVESEIIYDRMFASHVDDLECTTTIEDYLSLVSSNNSLRN